MEQYYLNLMQLIGFLSALIFGIIALLQRRKNRKLSEKIAEIQGVFKKSDISLELYKDLIPSNLKNPNNLNYDHYIFAFPLTPNNIFEIPLKFLITNNGDKTAKDLEIFIRCPKEFFYGGKLKHEVEASGRLKLQNYQHDIVSQTEFNQTLGIKIPSIMSKQSLDLNIYISIRTDTLVESKSKFTSADGVDIIATWQLYFNYSIDAVIMSEDINPISKKYCFGVIDICEKSAKEWFDDYNRLHNRDVPETKRNFMQRLFNFRVTKSNNINYFFYLLIFDDINNMKKKELKKGSLKVNIFRPEKFKACVGLNTERGFILPMGIGHSRNSRLWTDAAM